MNLARITRAELESTSGLLGSIDEEVSPRAVTEKLRETIYRWGVCPKREVLAHVRLQIRMIGREESELVKNCLQNLVSIGEVQEVILNDEVHLAQCEPRWVRVGDEVAALLSVAPAPKGLTMITPLHERDWVRRVALKSEDAYAMLQLSGCRELSFAEWLTPLGYLRHVVRRSNRAHWSDQDDLASFWRLLQDAFVEGGAPLNTDADVRAVTGVPGGFFGRHDSEKPQGRWSNDAPEGVWCGCRRGYSEQHWHWGLLSVEGTERRFLDLYDKEEWCWALLARGKLLGSEEVIRSANGRVELTFPLPQQLKLALELLGTGSGGWAWEVAQGAPEFNDYLR
jgi:hypothetical protein